MMSRQLPGGGKYAMSLRPETARFIVRRFIPRLKWG
ncbi:MAG: hypothetical protein GMKNLPBB_01319 [Myxococcota bacterium]|nr:hypothetical protein [Myxococcota bacterium]